ncbi:sulfate reduction electron transfer complex DsrMKJOP subunit DsrP [Bacteroidota bacterium]
MHLKEYFVGSLKLIFKGSKSYWAWVSLLLIFIALGVIAYQYQLRNGLIVTSMRDQVSWGFYIGNFTFLVGVAAAAIMLVVPAYVYNWGPLKEIVILGELLAISAILMCIMFIVVDMGHPERLWHMIPFIGILKLGNSILAWDSIALSIYLVLNIVIVFHILYRAFKLRQYNKKLVVPLVLLSIPMGIAIHTITAFLYDGIAARPFWNSAILAPKFLISAFCSGPAIMIILFQILRKATTLKISNVAIWKLAELMAYAMFFNLFLVGAELFKEFYSNTEHFVFSQYLYFGIGEHNTIVPFGRLSLLFDVIAFFLFLIPATRKNPITLNIGAVLIFAGVYIEKGIGLIIPGFTPDSLGEIYEYFPSLTEIFVTAGIFSAGFLIYTIMLKVAVPIVLGEFHYKKQPDK